MLKVYVTFTIAMTGKRYCNCLCQ